MLVIRSVTEWSDLLEELVRVDVTMVLPPRGAGQS